jgi:4-diphosphocytidyl-2-C-methyl-D-erythritol kinase
MTVTPPVSLQAPAKLTVSLRITGVRTDGYHLIDAEMVTLELADGLLVEPATRSSLDVTGPYAAGIPTDGTNLVLRALELAGVTARVHLHKRIPHGGGLGGGSADGAAILRWAGATDPRVAVRLGADVPFCVHGGRARVRGVGEVIDPLPAVARDFTLIIPPLVVPTPAVFRAWDDLGGPVDDVTENDLTAAAIAVVPELARWRDRIAEATGRPARLAGSGATWFVDGHQADLDEALAPAQIVTTRTQG